MNKLQEIFNRIQNIFQNDFANNRTIEIIQKLREGTMAVVPHPKSDSLTIQEMNEALQNGTFLIQGTAFAVSSNQFITCNHVIESFLDTHEIFLHGHIEQATGPPSIIHHVSSIQADPELDLALMETDKLQGEVRPIKFEKEFPPTGLNILAVGFPLPEHTVLIDENRRINIDVTGIFRVIKGIVATKLADGLHFEIDKLVNEGQSGGPVVSLKSGDLIGMCQAFRHYPSIIGTQNVTIVADLSICLSADAIRKKLIEWDCEI